MKTSRLLRSLRSVAGGSLSGDLLMPARSAKKALPTALGLPKRHQALLMDNPETFPSAEGLSDMIAERLHELMAKKASPRAAAAVAVDESDMQRQLFSPRAASAIGGADQEEAVRPGPRDVAHAPQPFLLKALQRAGCSSRREAVELVASGSVQVNAQPVTDPFFVVAPGDDIRVKGMSRRLRFSPPRLWIYHKPRNTAATLFDSRGRNSMARHAQILGIEHLVPIGGLPFGAHGLMLLTNDGALAAHLEHPSTMLQHTFRLRVKPAIGAPLAQRLNEKGVEINGKFHRNVEFAVDPRRSPYFATLKIRGDAAGPYEIMKALGRHVSRGGRTSLGPFQLNGLALGGIREVAVPEHLMSHTTDLWRPFVEHDWPFFRRRRILQLRKMSHFRTLSQKETEELDIFSSEELQDSFRLSAETLEEAADEMVSERPMVHIDFLPDDATVL